MTGPASPARGRFIAFEGGEACGKSTQSSRLAEALGAVLTREPGGTDIGARVRSLVLDPATVGLAPRAEALLMAADRAQHVAEVVEPALAAGRHVVTDRFAGSSIAYQGFGRGLPVAEVRRISEWATGGVWPDLVILLDVPAEVADRRLGAERDRMESEPSEFHAAVLDGFRAQAAAEPERWAVVDGTGTVDEVAEALLMAADRAQHVAEVVEPALAAGRHVVTDRFAGSSIAYQGFGRGLPVDEVRRISEWATGGVWPDLVILLDVPADVADRRLGADRDRMESEPSEFHAAVLDGFRAQAAAEPERWAVVDGTGTVDEVAEAVRRLVAERLQLQA